MLPVVKILPKQKSMTFFLRSTIHHAKFCQMHVSVTIMTANDHVPQFPEGRLEDDFWKIFAEINISLFLREGARIGVPCCGTLEGPRL